MGGLGRRWCGTCTGLVLMKGRLPPSEQSCLSCAESTSMAHVAVLTREGENLGLRAGKRDGVFSMFLSQIVG